MVFSKVADFGRWKRSSRLSSLSSPLEPVTPNIARDGQRWVHAGGERTGKVRETLVIRALVLAVMGVGGRAARNSAPEALTSGEIAVAAPAGESAAAAS